MPSNFRRRPIEDPNNTWNSQLMQACLERKISDAEALLANGADPVGACETVPFYSEPVPPLIALLLQGQYTTESVAMMNWLIQRGASVSQLFLLQGKNFPTTPAEEGTILHLLVGSGQFAQLMELLALVGERRPPPVSIQRSLQREVVHTARNTSGTTPGTVNRLGSVFYAGGKKRSDVLHHVGHDLLAQNSQNIDILLHLDGPIIDFEVRTSVRGLTALELALHCADAPAVQLLMYYGASGIFHQLVNGSQTALARACAAGDKEAVELLLDAGDSIRQISMDGRYTLIHYAAAHPAVLDLLLARGLSIDAKNSLGESALVSLICYGQGLNAEYSIRETQRSADAQRLASLPSPALQNYILTPIPPVGGSTGKQTKFSNAVTTGSMLDMDYPCITHDVDAWWYFASHSNTWNMIQNLCDRGADVHGDLSSEALQMLESRYQQNQAMRSTPNVLQQNIYDLTLNSSFLFGKAGSLVSPSRSGSFEDTSFVEVKSTICKNESDNTRFGTEVVTHQTPLMHAIVAYHPELICRLLIDYHVDPMVQDSRGACALHYAAISRHPSVIEFMLSPLVSSIYSNIDFNAQDCCGRTPLHYAAANGNIGAVRALLGVGGSVLNFGKTDCDGRTPLHLAVLANETAVVELFLQHCEASATVDTVSTSQGLPSKRRLTNARRKCGGGRPSVAIEVNAVEQTTLVDVEAEDRLDGRTALEMAVCETQNVTIARLLLTVGYASLRHDSGLPTGGSLLHRTVFDGNLALMVLLLEKYADPNDIDNLEQTPLHLAAQSTHPQACCMVRELLRFGALADVRSGHTLETPILIAARRGDADMLNLLMHQQEEFLDGFSSPPRVLRTSQRDRECARAFGLRPTLSLHLSQARNAGRQLKQQQQQQQLGQFRVKQGLAVNSSMSFDNPDFFLATDSSAGGVNANNSNNSVSNNKNNSNNNTEARQVLSPFSHTGICADSVSPTGEAVLALGTGECSAVDLHGSLNPHFMLLTDGYVRTTLHYLCSTSDAEKQVALLPIIQEILHCPIGLTLVLQVDADGRLPLHDACAAGFTAAVKELLLCEEKTTAFFLDSRGCTPLHYAVLSDNSDCIVTLVQFIKMWLPCRLQGVMSAVDDARALPITSRILKHHQKHERNVQSRHNKNNFQQKPRIILFDKDCHRDTRIDDIWAYLNVHDGMGRTPLLLAAELGHINASKTLMQLFLKYPKFGSSLSSFPTDRTPRATLMPFPQSVDEHFEKFS